MDFGAGDIIAGLRLAVVIYEFGFNEENGAGKQGAAEAEAINGHIAIMPQAFIG